MPALGCLALVLFPLLGLVATFKLAGAGYAVWGAVGGFLVATALVALLAYPLIKARRK